MSDFLRAAIRDGDALRAGRARRRLDSIPCDSPEGAQAMMEIARSAGLLLGGAHRALARKHGVSIEGIRFNDQPTQ